MEDITQAVSPILRLFGACLSALLFFLVYRITIKNTGFEFIDNILNYDSISIIFTLICIIFLTQSFNIIDGLNGLSLSSSILAFCSIMFIASELNDRKVLFMSNVFFLILVSILVFNFAGKIFLGDSGAYLLGMFLSATVIILFVNNQTLSPFLIAQILIYPSYELLRTVVRRVINRKNILLPDSEHLHSIINEYNTKKYFFSTLVTNIMSSTQLVFLQILNFTYICFFFDSPQHIVFGILMFILIYEAIYIFIKKYSNI